MRIFNVYTALVTTVLMTAGSAQAFELLTAEDLNYNGLNTRAALNLTQQKEQQFLSNFDSSIGTEEFESFSDLTSANMDLSFPGAGTATFSGNGVIHNITNTANPDIAYDLEQGLYPASGNQYLYTEATPNADGTFTINFSEEIAGFGFYAYDLGDWGAELSLKLYHDEQLVDTVSNLHTTQLDGSTTGSVIYVGILGELQPDDTRQVFNRVEFTTAGNNIVNTNHDIFAFDNMTIATANQIITSNIFAD
ncbi:hypothetical protein [Pleurocapsa sp. PCC 7319]|uniref:hypothetical protein n=1 Tax=Pleurocapsa sp. PCC 7319 TaxID=118161 RepID=UPI00036A99D1|nr:hypothetical protein [Pleurocapsa sp. PCC 7319]